MVNIIVGWYIWGYGGRTWTWFPWVDILGWRYRRVELRTGWMPKCVVMIHMLYRLDKRNWVKKVLKIIDPLIHHWLHEPHSLLSQQTKLFLWRVMIQQFLSPLRRPHPYLLILLFQRKHPDQLHLQLIIARFDWTEAKQLNNLLRGNKPLYLLASDFHLTQGALLHKAPVEAVPGLVKVDEATAVHDFEDGNILKEDLIEYFWEWVSQIDWLRLLEIDQGGHSWDSWGNVQGWESRGPDTDMVAVKH